MHSYKKTCALWFCALLVVIATSTSFFTTKTEGEATDNSGKGSIADEFLTTLSTEEKAWLQAHPVIRVTQDPGWPPVEFTNEAGEPSGMSADYLHLVEQRMGITFVRIPVKSWREAYTKLKNWEVDMTTSVATTPQRTEFWAFTEPYLNIPIVIATQSNVSYVADIKELFNKRIAVVKGYAVDDWVTRDFPEIQLIHATSTLDGLEMLQRGEVFAYLDNLLIIGDFQAKMKVGNIKIAGQTPYVNAQCMAVRKDWAPLAGILQKTLASISETEHKEIYRRWLPVRYEHGFNYILFWKIATAFTIILLMMLLWNRQLTKEIKFRKQAEEEKEKLQEQLRQAQKMESIGQLAGGVAHDFNNMLGVILGHSELAIEKVDPSHSLYDNLKQIRKAAKRSADITKQLLAFARKQTITPVVLDLNVAVQGMLKMLLRLIGEDIDLVWLPKNDLWSVKTDQSQINQILVNLCVNARDAVAGVGKIVIETANSTLDEGYCLNHVGFRPGEFVKLTVSDNGHGMDKETLTHIFEPFFTTKGVGRGTGLGLATVYGTVKQNNGFINAYSEPGQGATFSIYLPRHIGTIDQTRPEVVPELAVGGSETILLVEDESAILEMTKIILQNLGYTVLSANGPPEALLLAENFAGKIHLLVTDVIMPEMSGRDLEEQLRQSRPEIKCLFMSGYTANIIASQGVLDDEVHFIQKPFAKNGLATKIREALDI